MWFFDNRSFSWFNKIFKKFLCCFVIFISLTMLQCLLKSLLTVILGFATVATYNVELFRIEYGPLGFNCPKPNDIHVHSCDNVEYPRSNTTCKCSVNSKHTVTLICRTDLSPIGWRRLGERFTCTDDKNIGKTTEINYVQIRMNASTKCYKPEENLYRLHSCATNSYPRLYTSCRCSNNYDWIVSLACDRGKWYFHQKHWKAQCIDSTPVVLSSYQDDDISIDRECDKPEEFLNIFHACEKANYPSYTTYCNCTYNPKTRITLACNLEKNWVRYGPNQTCKYNFLPHLVRCSMDEISASVRCNCINNCFKLDIKLNLTFDDIYKICNNLTTQHIKSEHLKLSFNSTNSNVHYECESGFTLVGPKQLTCYNGKLASVVHICAEGNNIPEDAKIDLEFYMQKNYLYDIIHCNKNNSELTCNCVKNCFTIVSNPRYFDINGACNTLHYNDDEKHIELYYNQEENSVHYFCADKYELKGNHVLKCDNGMLNDSLPHCEKSKTQKESLIYINNFTKVTENGCVKPKEINQLDAAVVGCNFTKYPKEQLSCFCFNNYPVRIKFNCYNNSWFRATELNICNGGYINSSLAYCRQESKSQTCHCRNSCVELNEKHIRETKQKHKDIEKICSGTENQYFEDKHLTIKYVIMNKTLGYSCDNWYKLVGLVNMSCIDGTTGEEAPKCELDVKKILTVLLLTAISLLTAGNIIYIAILFNWPSKCKNKFKELRRPPYEEPEYDDPDAVRPSHARPVPEYMDMDTDDPPDLPARPIVYDDARIYPEEDELGYMVPRGPAPVYDYVYMHLHPRFRFKNRIGVIKRNSF